MSRNICMVIAAALVLAGCDMIDKQDTQYDDSRNPYYKKAQADIENSPEAAIMDYEMAIGANPKLTEAHYQLGHIYADKLSNPIGAIFHFEEYLRLAPTGSHADEVKALIEKESEAFAASLPNSAPQSADQYAKLQTENAALRKQVEDQTKTIVRLKHHHDATVVATSTNAPAATPPAAPAPEPVAITTSTGTTIDSSAPAAAAATPAAATDATTNAVAATPPRALPLDAPNPAAATATGTIAAAGTPAADAGPSRSYTIVKGDSLWKIAHKMYPGDTNNGIDKIKDANKEVLPPGKPLKIGQVLVIPQ